MRMRETGAVILTGDFAGERHTPTFRCNHCGGTIRMSSMQHASESGDRCPQCDSHICKRCAETQHKTLRCDVFWEKLARVEAADRLRREAEA